VLHTIIAIGLSATAPGGLVELAGDSNLRQPPAPSTYLPNRGAFTFPAPYGTRGIRLTNPSDCGGGDCVSYAGYSYWRNINAHRGQPKLLAFVGLRGPGPTLFEVDKETGAVTNLGPLFDEGSPLRQRSGEGWYFSATRPNTLYIHDGPRLLRYDVRARSFETVLDITGTYSGYLWQVHSSNDDLVHSMAIRGGGPAGCFVFDERTGDLERYGTGNEFDECQIDKSGRWLVIKEQVDGANAEDNRIIDLANGTEQILRDESGAGGHSDNGFGYMIAEDNWATQPSSFRLWRFDALDQPSLVYHGLSWSVGVSHIAHANAVPNAPLDQQYACASHMGPTDVARANEIVCYLLDGSTKLVVVAPTMTNSNASGGGDFYGKMPKANIDPTGEYIFWTSNMATSRLDAFLVQVPWQHLVPERPSLEPAGERPPVRPGLMPELPIYEERPNGGTSTRAADPEQPFGCAGVLPGPLGLVALGLIKRRRTTCRSCDAAR
jgi:hypothetical protein